LNVGNASNVSNIHAFVGAISSHRLEAIASIHIPERDRFVPTATGESASIGTEFHRPRHICMPGESPQAFTRIQIPEFNPTIDAAAGESFGIGAVLQR
jgi:hypothetical protein